MTLMMLRFVTGMLGWVSVEKEGKCPDVDAPECMEEVEV